MEQLGVVAGNLSLSLIFAHLFKLFSAYFRLQEADHCELGIIRKIFSSLRRLSIDDANFGRKVMTSEVEERARLVTGGYWRQRSQWVKAT